MPLLASLLGGLFGGLADFFARWVTKKVAVGAAALVAFTGITLAMWAAVLSSLGLISVAFPASPAVLVGVWLMVPDNGPLCVSVMLSIDATIALYRWNFWNFKLVVEGT